MEQKQEQETDDAHQQCLASISKLLETLEEESEEFRKISFLKDQIGLVFSSSTHKYTPEFIWTALTWMKTSPALYRLLRTDGLLTLPSPVYLKQISSSFSLETGLSESVLAYLKKRIEPLSKEERLVSLIIDEVSIQVNFNKFCMSILINSHSTAQN